MTSTSVSVTGGPAWAAQGTAMAMQAESSVSVRSWQDSALDDADRFTADLQTLGLHEDDVNDGATLARSVESDALTRLSNWFSGRKIVVDDRELVQVELPLFVLSAYNAAGCGSSYQATSDQSRRLGWNVTVFGTGLGGEATVSSSVTSTLAADAGQACLIFLPVTVAVEQVRVVAKDGSTVSSGQRVDVSPAKAQSPVPGARLLDSNVLPAAGASVQTYALSGYAATTPAEYQYVYTQEKAVSIQTGVKAFGANIGISGSVTMSKSVTLDFRLAGGHDYRLCKLAGGDVDGLVWE